MSMNITLQIITQGGAVACDTTAELRLSVRRFGKLPAPCCYQVARIAVAFSVPEFNNVSLLTLPPSENIN
jgi:hypothetical protein